MFHSGPPVCVCVCVSLAVAELKAEAARIETNAELECQARAREAEIQFLKEQNKLETSKARELGKIEVSPPWWLVPICQQPSLAVLLGCMAHNTGRVPSIVWTCPHL